MAVATDCKICHIHSNPSLLGYGVPYRCTAAEIDLLKGIRPGDSSTREIPFVVDRERARGREFTGRHDV